MAINVRTKGQTGEREVAKILNTIVADVRDEIGLPVLSRNQELFQRNQQQSSVGGSDLANPLGLSIEVKRQEALSVTSWWRQCVTSAEKEGGIPILIFRENRRPWRVYMIGQFPLDPRKPSLNRHLGVEISFPDFKCWVYDYIMLKLHTPG